MSTEVLEDILVERLAQMRKRFQEIEAQLSRPETARDPQLLQRLAREHAELQPLIALYDRYLQVQKEIVEARALLEEPEEELRRLAREDLERLEVERDQLIAKLTDALRPRDPNDQRDVIVEIRAGAGGEEASLFARDLMRMYMRYAERRGWDVELMYANETDLGGMKEVSFEVRGRGAYSRLKYESGVHRVQRVPITEAAGRIHTSTATVAVLPEPDEVEVQINEEDLRIDVFRSSGHGGQGVNTTDSAVRITHIPTGEVVTCQDERSQLKNKAKALAVLRARLYERELRRLREEVAGARRAMVGTAERAEKIRTYNFRENRVTDHRIGLTLYSLDRVLEGELDPIIDALTVAAEKEIAQV